MANPIRAQFGAEELAVARAAAKFEISCPKCRMKFESHRLLERHRAGFCEAGTVVDRTHVQTITAEQVQGYCAGQPDKKAIGHLTLKELKQAFQSSSLPELQQRSLHAEQLALAAQLRSYKLSAFAPQQAARNNRREGQAAQTEPQSVSQMLAAPTPAQQGSKGTIANSVTAIIAQSIIAKDRERGDQGLVLPPTFEDKAAKAKESHQDEESEQSVTDDDATRKRDRRSHERRAEKKRSKHKGSRRRGDSDTTDDESEESVERRRSHSQKHRDHDRRRGRRSRSQTEEESDDNSVRKRSEGRSRLPEVSKGQRSDKEERPRGSGQNQAQVDDVVHAGARGEGRHGTAERENRWDVGPGHPSANAQFWLGHAPTPVPASGVGQGWSSGAVADPNLFAGGWHHQPPPPPMMAAPWAPDMMPPPAGIPWHGGYGGMGLPVPGDAGGVPAGIPAYGPPPQFGVGLDGAWQGPQHESAAGVGVEAGLGLMGDAPAMADGSATFGGAGQEAASAVPAGGEAGDVEDGAKTAGAVEVVGQQGADRGGKAAPRYHMGGGGLGAARGLHHLRQQGPNVREKSQTWYEVVEETGYAEQDGQQLMAADDALGTDNIIGMAVDHGHRMTHLKEQTEKLELKRRLVGLENELEAGRTERQRMEWLANQRAHMRQAVELRADIPEDGNYDPVLGFELHVDWIQAVPDDAVYVQLRYGLFQGGQALLPMQTSRIEPAIYQIAAVTNHVPVKRIVFHISKFYKRLPPVDDVLLLVEAQEVTDAVSTRAIGWTAVPIFSGDNQLLEGCFASPLLVPPLLLDLVPISRYDTAARIDNCFLYVRLRPNSTVDSELIEEGGGKLVLAARGGRFEDGWAEGAHMPVDRYELPWVYQVQTPRWIRQEYELPPEEEEEVVVEEPVEDGFKPIVPVAQDSELDVPPEAWCPYPHDEDADLRRCGATDLIMVTSRQCSCPFVVHPLHSSVVTFATQRIEKTENMAFDVGFAHDRVPFQICLDAVRFLPDNVGLARASLSIVNEVGDPAFPNAELRELPDIRSGVHSPMFKLAAVFEAGTSSLRAWIRVKVEALDVHTQTHVTVGFAVAPLFISEDTGRALSEEEAQRHLDHQKRDHDRYGDIPREGAEGLLVREGGLQLPLRAATSLPGTPDKWPMDTQTVGRLPRLPCCSALLRVFVNPGKQDVKNALHAADLPTQLAELSVDEPDDGRGAQTDVVQLGAQLTRIKPRYSAGWYNSNSCLPSGVERVTFRQRLSTFWRDMSPRDVLHRLFGREQAEHLRLAEDDNEVLQALATLFADSTPRPAIDLTYFCAYNPSIGFKVSVDGANNIPSAKGQWPVCVFGVVPPCAYFGPEQLSLNAHFHSSLDPGCTPRFPRWAETFVTHQNVPFRGTGTALVVQVLGISREARKGQTVLHKTEIGWSAMPIFFDNDLPYLIDGGFQLPLYKGAVPRVLPKLLDDKGVDGALQREERKKKVQLLDGASVLIRISDLQRGATSHPIDAPNATETDPGIPSDCDDRFIRKWLDGSPRIKSTKWLDYKKVLSAGFFSGKEVPIAQMIGGTPFADFDRRLRLDTQTLTRISPTAAAANTEPDPNEAFDAAPLRSIPP